MAPQRRAQVVRNALLGLLVVTATLFSAVAEADEPALAIHHSAGEIAVYPVTEIERIEFEGDAALLVVTSGGADSYPAESITRIEFLWGTSAVEDPEDAVSLIKAIHLFQNQPNPFSERTRIGFELCQAGRVELCIYSPDGRLVRRLLAGDRPVGQQEVYWDGVNDSGRRVSSGIYFYDLRAPGIQESRRMILLP